MIPYPIQAIPDFEDVFDVITPHNVKKALAFQESTYKQPNPLEQLTLVDQFIIDCLFPNCAYAYKLALVEILHEIVTSELIRHRQIMEIPQGCTECSISGALNAIVEDGRTTNSKLLMWSWLYYRYVRSELNINQQQFCELVCIDDRTIRRYQETGFRRVVDILIRKESMARRSRSLASEAVLKREAPASG
jgi:hypothetical protein